MSVAISPFYIIDKIIEREREREREREGTHTYHDACVAVSRQLVGVDYLLPSCDSGMELKSLALSKAALFGNVHTCPSFLVT